VKSWHTPLPSSSASAAVVDTVVVPRSYRRRVRTDATTAAHVSNGSRDRSSSLAASATPPIRGTYRLAHRTSAYWSRTAKVARSSHVAGAGGGSGVPLVSTTDVPVMTSASWGSWRSKEWTSVPHQSQYR
jgi:hypothetical protein